MSSNKRHSNGKGKELARRRALLDDSDDSDDEDQHQHPSARLTRLRLRIRHQHPSARLSHHPPLRPSARPPQRISLARNGLHSITQPQAPAHNQHYPTPNGVCCCQGQTRNEPHLPLTRVFQIWDFYSLNMGNLATRWTELLQRGGCQLPSLVLQKGGLCVAMRLLWALQLVMRMCAGTTEAGCGVSLLPKLGFL
jgi:hypothetical protein